MNKKHSMSDVVSITFGGMKINHQLDKYACKDGGYATIGYEASKKRIIESMTDDVAIVADYIGENKVSEIEIHADFSSDDFKQFIGKEVDVKIESIERDGD